MIHARGYRLPIRTWEALDAAVENQETRIATLEGKVAVLLIVLAIMGTMTLGVLGIALTLALRARAA